MSHLEKFLSLSPVESFANNYSKDITEDSYFGFPLSAIIQAEENLYNSSIRSIAYFSMEYGLSTNTYNVFSSNKTISDKNFSDRHHVFSNMRTIDYYMSVNTEHRLDLPIYSGGLGVLAGDTLKSAADRQVPLVAVGILWNKGYFKQNFWFKNGQIPEETQWDTDSFPGLIPLNKKISIPLKKETIHLKLWKYYVYNFEKNHVIPLILLDSRCEENSEFAKELTGQLYRSDNAEWKLLQRLILGMGGMKALEVLGYPVQVYHLNEGHAALAFVEKALNKNDQEIEALKNKFNYTCHTPVAAGHDRFQKKLAENLLPENVMALVREFGKDPHQSDVVNFTELAMNTCHHVNAVAAKHGEVTRLQFPHFKDKIDSITNGVHSPTWISKSIETLLDQTPQTSNWRKNFESFWNVKDLSHDATFRQNLWNAHQTNKKNLCHILKSWKLEPEVFTICWARRIASYKRPGLLLQDAKQLIELSNKIGPIQVIFAGKAHPKDDIGFSRINEMMNAIDLLEGQSKHLKVLMLENYDTYFGKLLASSVDVWLNNPLPPFEASGTSGMKAILNGVLQLSTLDGWVVEAADKNLGWIFGWEHHGNEVGDESHLKLEEDSKALYTMLETVVGLYYQTIQNGQLNVSSDWITKMCYAIAASGFFNTDRMVAEYQDRIWKS